MVVCTAHPAGLYVESNVKCKVGHGGKELELVALILIQVRSLDPILLIKPKVQVVSHSMEKWSQNFFESQLGF